jgi:uncharacterized damage-inducible protein DinB
MKVSCLIEAIEAARESWDRALEQVPASSMETRMSAAGWSVKDVVAHVVWHELEMIELVESRALAGSDWWAIPTDERNAKIHAQSVDRPLDEVLEEAEDAYQRMMKALATLSDEDLNDPSRFQDMPEDWKPWRLLANNTYEHYLRHVGQVRKLATQMRDT